MIKLVILCGSLHCSQLIRESRIVPTLRHVLTRDTGLDVRLVVRRDRSLNRVGVSATPSDVYRVVASKVGATNGKTIAIIAPRKNRISIGMAPVCSDFGFAALVDRSPIANRLNARVIAHEFGHLLGAEHTNNGSVMDSVVSSLGPLWFGGESVEQIRKDKN